MLSRLKWGSGEREREISLNRLKIGLGVKLVAQWAEYREAQCDSIGIEKMVVEKQRLNI